MKTRYWDSVLVNVPVTGMMLSLADEYISLENSTVKPDSAGNFIMNSYSELELDAIHAFAVAKLTIDIWERAVDKKIIWQWNEGAPHNERPLQLVIEPAKKGADFSLVNECATFGVYGDDNLQSIKSIDIVAHEVTHAIIESIRPDIHFINTIEAFAVVEALADITPMLLLMSDENIVKKISHTLNITNENPLSEFAEGYGPEGKGIRSTLRNIDARENTSYALGKTLVDSIYIEVMEKTKESPSGFVGLLAWAEELAHKWLYPIVNLREMSPNNYKLKVNY